MGLDLYWYAKTKRKVVEVVYKEKEYDENYISFSHWRAEEGAIDLTSYPEELKELGEYIYRTNFKSQWNDKDGRMYYQIGYFRKFNALHKYMCDLDGGRDECQDILIKKEDLIKLLSILDKVNKNHNLADVLLPTQRGFFFGDTKYDQWYFEDVKDAIEMVEIFLEKFDFENYDLIYCASW